MKGKDWKMRRKPHESGEANRSNEGKKSPLVGIVMGSDSDLPVMEEAERILEQFKVPYEVTLSSAHRSPDRTHRYTVSAEEKGLEVIIVGAGAAAHLAGVIAAKSTLPVIGVPIDSSPLKGMDSLLSTVQMPGGVPVATMAVGRAGARNAAILAVQILALKYPRLREALKEYKKRLEKEVEEKAKRIRKGSM
jgi:phosphoribosylaminoimidazole carboxylase PurE protein